MYILGSLPLLVASLSSLVFADPVVQCVGSATGTNPVTPAEASSAIDSFCGTKDFWNTTIVSPISMGQNHPARSTALVSNSLVHNGADNIWLRASFKEGDCVGSFMFTYGTDDPAKKQHCMDNFLPIINKCDSGTPDKRYGGNSTNVCQVYQLAISASGHPDPLAANSFTGTFQCQDTNTTAIGGSSSPLFGTCTCSYSALPDNTEIYDKPTNGSCTAMTTMPAETHIS